MASKYVETTQSQKTVGLYLNLAKALNALEAAGEDVQLTTWAPMEITGISGITVRRDSAGERFQVVQA